MLPYYFHGGNTGSNPVGAPKLSITSSGFGIIVYLVLAHDRRRSLYFNVTRHPTAEWTGQQLRNAFPVRATPALPASGWRCIYGRDFREQVRDIGIDEESTPRAL